MDSAKLLDILKKYTMIIVLVLVTLFFTIKTDGNMLLPQNVNNLIAQNAYVFILATGMLLCILTGGNIDLSIGSIICFVGAVGGHMMVNLKVSPALAIAAMLVVGILIGAWQGFWIAYIRIPPFIVTLSGMLVFRGLSNVVLNGRTLAPMPENYLVLFNSFIPDFFQGQLNGKPFNITCVLVGIIAVIIFIIVTMRGRMNKLEKGYQVPHLAGVLGKLFFVSLLILAFTFRLAQYKGLPSVLIWIMVVVLVYGYITSKTTTGRYFYAVGGNEKATALSGIDTNRVYFIAYLNMGFLSGVAALVTIARLNSANPTAGTNYEMDAIAACYIGGASAYGTATV